MKSLFDLFPAIAFFAAFYLGGKDIIYATTILMIASVAQVLLGWLLWRKIDRMHLVVLGIVLIFGGLTLLFRDETFIKLKPTIVDGVFVAVLLGSDFLFQRNLIRMGAEAMVKRMGEGMHIVAPDSTWRWVNLAAAAFFAGCGALNVWLIGRVDTETWVDIKTFGYPVLNILFMIVLMTWLWRHIVQPKTDTTERNGK